MATTAIAPARVQRNALDRPHYHSTHSSSSQASHPQAQPSDPAVSSVEKHAYLFGANLKASLSPFLHDVIYKSLGLKWAQFPLDSLDMSQFLHLIRDHPNFYGSSITMPHKIAIMKHLEWVTPECAQVGACNTVFLRPDPDNPDRRQLCGANTDVSGVRDAFLRNISDRSIWEGKPAMVLGGGGAARSAVYALWRYMRVTDIYIVNRCPQEARDLVTECQAKDFGDRVFYVEGLEEAKKLTAPGAVVACVPDYSPKTEGEIRARRVVEELMGRKKSSRGVMLEMCYNPTPYTKLGALVEGWGWNVILGTEALIYQGLEQDMYWTGRTMDELPVQEVHEAIAEKVAERAREHKEMKGFYF